jgi:hypothetical protein
VTDPEAPEHAATTAIHLGWWRTLATAMRARTGAPALVAPEYGPYPYLPALPHSLAPVADLDAICRAAAARLTRELA